MHTDHKPITTIKEGKVHRRTLERFRDILANYDFKLEYKPGAEMPSDYMSRHVKVDSIEINCKELHSLLVENNEKNSVTKQDETKSYKDQTEKIEPAWCSCVSSPKVAHEKSRTSVEPRLQQCTDSRSNLKAHSNRTNKELSKDVTSFCARAHAKL